MSKDQKSSLDKFKQFFRGLNKGNSGVTRSRSYECVVLTEEFEAELRPENAIANRLKAVREFEQEIAKSRRLEHFTVEKLWSLLSDLLKPENTKETRHLLFRLFTKLCQWQGGENDYLRAKFFNFIKCHTVEEDASPRFEFLKALTENGQNIRSFEEKISPFLLSWMTSFFSSQNESKFGPNTGDFMIFIVRLIKYNQSFIDQNVLVGIVQNVCYISCVCTTKEDSHECLKVLDALVSYSSVPPGSLASFLATLCRAVNVESLCQTSWKIMRNLLGTQLGHSALLTMCQLMQGCEKTGDVALIRGAVFFVGVSLWGSKAVRSLACSPATVLSSLSAAVERNHPIISYEVMMRVADLVRNKADCLQSVSWDLVLEIVEKCVETLKTQPGQDKDPQIGKILIAVNEVLDAIEGIVDTGAFSGSQNRFYAVVDASAEFRPENSVLKLLKYKVDKRLQSVRPGWFTALIEFAEKHYRLELRCGIKVRALNHIEHVALMNQETHEEELIDKVLLPYLKGLEGEPDPFVRQNGVKFIVNFMIESGSRKGHDLLQILEKIVNRPYDLQAQQGDTVHIFTDLELSDVFSAINGLVELFERKIYQLPSTNSVTAYKIIVRHLNNHYRRPLLDNCHEIRYKIFECFFRIRANSFYHLGFPRMDENYIVYSPYLAVDHRDGDKAEASNAALIETEVNPSGVQGDASQLGTFAQNNPSSGGASPPIQQGQSGTSIPIPPPTHQPTVTYISLTVACKLVVSSLKKEKDWRVLELVLQQLPFVMENKALILSRHGNDIDYLANALCAMVTDKSLGLPETLRNWPSKASKSDFQAFLFPILTALVSYHSHLESSVQQRIVKCLEYGLVSKCSRICILSLSICSLEMKDTMHKLLPEVLLSLSKISPKINIAIPVLEFLSTLIHLPRVFASFVQDQYRAIFAIALPYTNPFKFNQYTVSLAHHVIAMWFLKCRLIFRKGFVSYIIKGLEANVWAPFEEESRKNTMESRNEDSSNRKRSSSLTENTLRRRERPKSGSSQCGTNKETKPTVDKALMTFHQELSETCVDLMGRYAFADCSALPTRFPSTGFLLAGGHCQSWLMDNKVITITTSGCTQKELRDGLCDKCWLLCRKTSETETQRRPTHSLPSLSPGGSKTDEVFEPNKSDTEGKLLKTETEGEFHSSILPPLTPEIKSSVYCTCWCQGWAEIHIRRPTGNSSWMMRVQNEIGKFSNSDIPLKDLSTIYLRHFTEEATGPSSPGSTSVSPFNSFAGKAINFNQNQEGANSPKSPISPVSPLKDCPDPMEEDGKRNPVRRSNSSPEMSSSFKLPYASMNQGEIEEQDEDEEMKVEIVKKEEVGSQETPEVGDGVDGGILSAPKDKILEVQIPASQSVSAGGISPFRRSYEAIPEEAHQKGSNGDEEGISPLKRDRMFTISVMTPAGWDGKAVAERRRSSIGLRRMLSSGNETRSGTQQAECGIRSGMSPSFIFLQLCAQGFIGSNSKPLHIPQTPPMDKTLKVLDYIPPYETHKLGVVYVGPGQVSNETAILLNQFGSTRYRDFLEGLGSLIKLKDVDIQKTYIGGLSRDGDGEFAYIWQDDVMQVIFHVATLMPNKPSDPYGNFKKCHIGNDYVAIVYNNSDEDYDIGIIKAQFLYACVIIQPLDHKTNRVTVKAKPNIADHIGHTEPKIVSDQNLPIMVRQIALHLNLASVIFQNSVEAKKADPYASNWLERLRQIKRLRSRLLQEAGHVPPVEDGQVDLLKRTFNVEDFTEFV